jgi:hypothetical protein
MTDLSRPLRTLVTGERQTAGRASGPVQSATGPTRFAGWKFVGGATTSHLSTGSHLEMAGGVAMREKSSCARNRRRRRDHYVAKLRFASINKQIAAYLFVFETSKNPQISITDSFRFINDE